jgi:hypothetical protein
MDKRELTIDDLDEVAGGMMAHPGPSLGPFIPPSTGPTIPVEPTPVIVYL